MRPPCVASTMLGLVLLLTGPTGCTTNAVSRYSPRHVAHGELTLQFNSKLEIYAGSERLTEAPGFAGLEEYVRCVPEAQRHASSAQSGGTASTVLAVLGGSLGVASLGSLGGLALFDQDRDASFAILGAGVLLGVIGIVLGALSRAEDLDANGHAVDAVNYYNDDVGSWGEVCP